MDSSPPADQSEPPVLMLLLQCVLRWLMPARVGMEPPAVRIPIAPAAVEPTASQHPHGLAPIHAPPPPWSLASS
jgi:hypothetical protein